MYLIKWKGFSVIRSTWEPIENLGNCQDAVKKYEEKQKRSLEAYAAYDRSSMSPSRRAGE